jgi:hypothetical protein
VGRAFPRGHCHHLNPLLSPAANAGLFPFAFPGCRHRVGTRASGLQHLVPQSETRPRPPRRGFFFGAMRIAWWRAAPKERLRLIWRSPCMSLRADVYRQKAAEAKQSAAKATSPSKKEHLKKWRAVGWCLPNKWSGLPAEISRARRRQIIARYANRHTRELLGSIKPTAARGCPGRHGSEKRIFLQGLPKRSGQRLVLGGYVRPKNH